MRPLRRKFIGGFGLGIIAVMALLVETRTDARVERFDHEEHLRKVFYPAKVECSSCHAFKVDPVTRRAQPLADLARSSLTREPREICHECHRSGEAKWAEAPKACTTCHRSMESLTRAMPSDHRGVGWKFSHSTQARIRGEACQDCHSVSQCAKCHLHRNDEQFANHSRNFRYTHSVAARAQPARCDACHTQSYCTTCHLKGR